MSDSTNTATSNDISTPIHLKWDTAEPNTAATTQPVANQPAADIHAPAASATSATTAPAAKPTAAANTVTADPLSDTTLISGSTAHAAAARGPFV
jgi:hypothetical protein